jgi:hypothetical protein
MKNLSQKNQIQYLQLLSSATKLQYLVKRDKQIKYSCVIWCSYSSDYENFNLLRDAT